MTELKNLRFLIISLPGRRLENLITLMESIESPKNIQTVINCDEALVALNTKQPTLIFLDLRSPKDHSEEKINKLIEDHFVLHTVFLQMRNDKQLSYGTSSTSNYIYDDLSIGTINTLIYNILSNAV